MPARPFRYFVILGSMRTGSNLLQRTLDQFADITCYGELFNPNFIDGPNQPDRLGVSRSQRDTDPDSLIEAMERANHGVAVPGYRYFDGHDPRALNLALHDRSIGKVILKRNPLDSFVSLKIAQTTGQWMLGKARGRKSAQIQFDIDEYNSYLARSEAFYALIETALQTTGQAAFRLKYPDVQELDVINGLGRWLGSEKSLQRIEPTIERQNPGSLEDKVINFEEMQQALAKAGGLHRTGEGTSGDRAGGLRFMHTCRRSPVLFAEVPGTDAMPIKRWLHSIDGGDPLRGDFEQILLDASPLGRPANRKALNDWLQTHPGALTFSYVSHPVERAYSTFMNHIWEPGDSSFPRIRAFLEEQYGLMLPEAEMRATGSREVLQRAGHDAEEHAKAFSAFLDFLRANLAGQTPIRVDRHWDLQSHFIEGFNTALPLSMVVRQGEMLPAAAYIRKLLNTDRMKNKVLRLPASNHIFNLSEIWSKQIEMQVRGIYTRDYLMFAFSDWKPAQAA
ncbi:sulfotransferase family 2 domain-containing protein [Pontivivens insulae]|uniref:Sulfotransferase domain-containing protein n=1 Tax=Pontivivens insulae TaxID=1639689 RepID=A0A2R8A832_9RHOB|nr:sulfotransferase family 2 domain-containing protein [Pontivivens insulae]RED18491.1 LPS sulfotransferase NodH [Pontivivens insulae]SPF28389.1 hypothetical protein POI8812_00688 [Pontivivens insulae]